jgi:hypothetical protein
MPRRDPRYQFCPRVGVVVRVCRTEGDCRGEFGCSKPSCPLEQAFDLAAFDRRMRAFATEFDLWPLRAEVRPADEPAGRGPDRFAP